MQIFVLELIMRGDPSSCYVETPRLRGFVGKNDTEESHGSSFASGVVSKSPHEIVFELIG